MKIIEKPVLALSDYEEVFRDLVSSLHSNFNLSKKPLTIDEISELYNEYGAREKPAIEDLQRAVLN
jgi:hypothetical protein